MSRNLQSKTPDEKYHPNSKDDKMHDGCWLLFSQLKLASMYASNGGGNAWMKIMGINDQGGKKKKGKDEKG